MILMAFSQAQLWLSDTALGSDLNTRSKNIRLIRLFEDLDMVALQKSDILGDAYEIGQFTLWSLGKRLNSIPLIKLVKSWLR